MQKLALWDESLARRQFPILSDFETKLEIERWTGGAVFEITNEIKKGGDASLRVAMDTSLYSCVFLKYFPGNWQEYSYFQFAAFNPQNTILILTCRIHDWRHTQGRQQYSDRFNHSFTIKKGWHLIRISLEKVKSAPMDREMDMQRIQGIGIFATKLPKSRIIYLDDVKLTK